MDLFSSLSLDCVDLGVSRHLAKILISSLLPIAIIVMIWLGHAVVAWGLRAKMRNGVMRHGPIYWSLFVTYLVAPTVMQTQLQGLDCFELASSGRSYLWVDVFQECSLWDLDYLLLLALDVPLILLYQAIPLMYLVLLYRKRDRLNPSLYGRDFRELPSAQDHDLKYAKRDKDPMLADLRFLFSVYRCPQWGFEVVEMYRRIVLLGFLPFIPSTVVRALVGGLLSFLSIDLYKETCPFHLNRNNVLAIGAQYQVFGGFVSAFIVLSESFPYSDNVLGVCLVLLNIFIIPLIVHSSHVSIKNDAEAKRTLAKLHAQLLTDGTEDKERYEAAWNQLKAQDEDAAERVLRGAAQLAEEFKNSGEASQLTCFQAVDELHAG